MESDDPDLVDLNETDPDLMASFQTADRDSSVRHSHAEHRSRRPPISLKSSGLRSEQHQNRGEEDQASFHTVESLSTIRNEDGGLSGDVKDVYKELQAINAKLKVD